MFKLENIELVHFEVTGKCNARCPMCSRHTKDGFLQPHMPQTHLSKEIFYKFFTHEFCTQLKHVYLSGVYGDPCMHPDLVEFCAHLAKYDIEVAIDTNGGYRKAEFWSALAKTGVQVNFAIDGLEDTNHLYRRGVRWDVVDRNIRAYSEAGGNAQWNFIVFEHNEHQVDEARRFADELGFDFRTKITQKFSSSKTWDVYEDGKKLYELTPPENEEYRHPHISERPYAATQIFEFDLKSPRWNELDDVEIDCKALQRKEIFLSYEGYVLPCCYVGTLYNDSPGTYQINQNLDLTKFKIADLDLETIVNNMNVIADTWNTKKVCDGKLITCARTCKKNNALKTQFIKQPSKSFCVLPWIHAQTKPNGQIKPCCRFDHRHKAYKNEDGSYIWDRFNINKGMTFKEAVESPEWQEIRDAMMENIEVPGCRKCYAEQLRNLEDKKRARSMRVKENWFWNKNNQFELEPPNELGKLRYIELALGNFCNLKCRTCTADLSSTWTEDENTLSEFYDDRHKYKHIVHVDQNWKVEDFEYVEEIKFTGGEPMLHPNFIKVMDLIISTGRADQVNLDIFTNVSWVPKAKVLDRLNQFKAVKINLSIDGLGAVNDYVRSPSDWPTVEESVIEWIKEEAKYPDRYAIKWAPCLSIYNVWQFTDMVDWWIDLQLKYKGKDFWNSITRDNISPSERVKQLNMIINLVHDPKYLSPTLYPEKEILVDKIQKQKDKFYNLLMTTFNGDDRDRWLLGMHFDSLYDKVISTVKRPVNEDDLKTFIEYTVDLDKLRNQDIRTAIPHVWDKVNEYYDLEYKGRIPA